MQLVDLIKDALQQYISELPDIAVPLAGVDRQARASLRQLVHKELSLWKASRKCIVSDCQNEAIRHSHTLQRAGPLTQIAENNWVLTPTMDAFASRVKMSKITTARASTFPGFCTHHEALFHNFEVNRRLEKDIDFVLQAYRATCRETVRLRIESRYVKEHQDVLARAFDRFLFSELAGRIRTRGIDTTPEAISDAFAKLDEHTHADAYDALIDASVCDLQALEKSHLAMLEQGIFSSAPFEFPVGSTRLPEQLPVCLSGLDCFNLQSGQIHRRVLLVLNVIPEHLVTYIVVSTSLENREFIGAYLDRLQGLLAGLNTIEAAMLHSTDHWFLRPSVWDMLPSTRQKAVLAEIMSSNTNSWDWTSLSIFDEIRGRLLDEIEAAKPQADRTVNERQVIDAERRKLQM